MWLKTQATIPTNLVSISPQVRCFTLDIRSIELVDFVLSELQMSYNEGNAGF